MPKKFIWPNLIKFVSCFGIQRISMVIKTHSHPAYHQLPLPPSLLNVVENKVILRNRICIPGSGPERI